MRARRLSVLGILAVFLALAAVGCGGGDDEGGGGGGDTMVFAGAADPVALDPALVSDGESIRVATQIFETLIGLKPGTGGSEGAAYLHSTLNQPMVPDLWAIRSEL